MSAYDITKHFSKLHVQDPKVFSEQKTTPTENNNLLWVEKYKPLHPAQLIGNTENVRRLTNFLQTWPSYLSNAGNTKRALLISGPPGIGKTAAVSVVAKALAYEVVEFNASDVRNQSAIEMYVSPTVSNHALTEFFCSKSAGSKKKTCLVMDEVDGMTAADRGGLLYLQKLIKMSKIPIICICNDAHQVKLTVLRLACVHLIWKPPSVEQCVSRLKEILRDNSINIEDSSLQMICEQTQGDLRQTLNMLQFWVSAENELSPAKVNKNLQNGEKDIDPKGPFEACKQFFQLPGTGSKREQRKGVESEWIDDRMNVFMNDPDMMMLMVQQNYLQAWPDQSRYGEMKNAQEGLPPPPDIESFCAAADYISCGDLVNTKLHTVNDWTLVPIVSVLAGVAPGAFVACDMPGMAITFPVWLGKTSVANKQMRILRDIHALLSIDSLCTARDMILFDLCYLRQKLLLPLASKGAGGIAEILGELASYGLKRDDWSDIVELGGAFSNLKLSDVPSPVKAAFTRKCNLQSVKSKALRPSGTFLAASLPSVADEETLPEMEEESKNET